MSKGTICPFNKGGHKRAQTEIERVRAGGNNKLELLGGFFDGDAHDNIDFEPFESETKCSAVTPLEQSLLVSVAPFAVQRKGINLNGTSHPLASDNG